MNDLMQSIRADLTSRRMLPFVLLAVGLLVGAIAYYAISGKAGSEPVAQRPSVQAPSVAGPSVTGAPANPNAAVAETTNGGRYQHGGHIRNPFSPLPSSESNEESSEASQSSASLASLGGGEAQGGSGAGASGVAAAESGKEAPAGSEESPGGGEAGSGESTGAAPSEAPQPPPVSVFEATATLKQAAPEGEAGAEPQTFAGLDGLKVLPGNGSRLLAFAGVQDAGKGALFLLLTPAIVHGDARCLPAKTSCESIYVKPQQAEELQYEKNGAVVSYTVTVSKVAKTSVPGAQAREEAEKQVGNQREQLEALGVQLPRKVAFSTKLPGVLSGVDAALQAARKSEAGGKTTPPSGTGE